MNRAVVAALLCGVLTVPAHGGRVQEKDGGRVKSFQNAGGQKLENVPHGFASSPPELRRILEPRAGRSRPRARESRRVPASPVEYARGLVGTVQFSCLQPLWEHESGWDSTADNPVSSAYGIAQLLGETSRDPQVQVDNGLRYIRSRYGSPCAAWGWWQRHRWY